MTALKKVKTENLSLFALSFDPIEELGNITWSEAEDILSSKLNDSFSLQELRAYLYFTQR